MDLDGKCFKFQKQPYLEKKSVLKICSEYTGKHPCGIAISIKFDTPRHGCSLVNLLLIFRALFYKNTYGGLLLEFPKINKSFQSFQF